MFTFVLFKKMRCSPLSCALLLSILEGWQLQLPLDLIPCDNLYWYLTYQPKNVWSNINVTQMIIYGTIWVHCANDNSQVTEHVFLFQKRQIHHILYAWWEIIQYLIKQVGHFEYNQYQLFCILFSILYLFLSLCIYKHRYMFK